MPRTRAMLKPWIEDMITAYGTESAVTHGQLRAQVTGEGQMTESQVQDVQGAVGCLFLTDGVVHMPAVITQSAWEPLQDQEDRECLSSLIRGTVCMSSYRLQFHMAAERTQCMFYLVVDQLSTVRSGDAKYNTPYCTSLSSVKMKICQMWRSQFAQEDTENSEGRGFDLTNLLDEWESDDFKDALEGVTEIVWTPLGRPASPQPSTSSCYPPPLPRSLRQSCVGWAADRVKWKGDEPFSVPVAHLLIPHQESLQVQMPSEGSELQRGLILPPERQPTGSLPASQHLNAPQSDVNIQTEHTVVLDRIPPADEDIHPQESVLHMASELVGEHSKGSPWDMFSPPCELLSESLSSEDVLTPDLHPNLVPIEVPVEVHPQPVAMATSTQIPTHGRSVSQTSGESKEDQSCLPPYQRPGSSASSIEAPESPSVTPPGLDTSSGRETSVPHPLPASDKERCDVDEQDEVVTGRSRTVKRKRSNRAGSESLSEEENEVVQRALSPPSPPTWLFDSQADRRGKVGGSCHQAPTRGTLQRQNPTVHSDGTPFSYPYKPPTHVSQVLRDFKVPDAMLHWAVTYLLPQKAEQQSSGSGFLSSGS